LSISFLITIFKANGLISSGGEQIFFREVGGRPSGPGLATALLFLPL